MKRMPKLYPTGERLVPQMQGNITYEHLHRYALAMEMAKDKVVLDIACGEGYGSNLLSQVAREVIGVDVSQEVVTHAQRAYAKNNLTFRLGTCWEIPVASQSIDVVVSFETLEHHDRHQEMMAECKRVLRRDGLLVISTPDKRNYTDVPGASNPFHVRELYFQDFEKLLKAHFKRTVILGQRMHHGSLIGPLRGGRYRFVDLQGDFCSVQREPGLTQPMYLIGICCDREELPPVPIGPFESKTLQTDWHMHLGQKDQEICRLTEEKGRKPTATLGDPHGNGFSQSRNGAVESRQESAPSARFSSAETAVVAGEKAQDSETCVSSQLLLRLVEQLDVLRTQMETVGARDAELQPLLLRLQDHLWYQDLLRRVRAVVCAATPAGATLVVVSKGDEELVNLSDRKAWHFPQTDSGAYAGHYPGESATAIAQLESLRQKGAQFLLLPASSLWWLESYAEFGRHVRSHYRLVHEQRDTCLIFALL